ncbi:MAG: hypothetical protein WBB59_14335 [Candidatus Microthrix parvicella]
MATTTVRLDEADERILDRLALEYNGRSGAIRHALRQLAVEQDRQALRSFLADWEAKDGPVDEAAVEAMSERYNL